MILVDTSVFVDHLRGQAMATKTLGSTVCAGDRVSASVLTKVELLWAMRADEKRAVRDLPDAVDWLPVTDASPSTQERSPTGSKPRSRHRRS